MRTETFLVLRNKVISGNAREKVLAENQLHSGLKRLGESLLKKKFVKLSEVILEESLNISIYKVFKRLESYNPDYTVSTWFGTILMNEIRDRIRVEDRRGRGKNDSIDKFYKSGDEESSTLDIADEFFCPSENFDKNVLWDALLRSMNLLNEVQRRILELHINGKTNSEIVELTGWNKNYVGTNLFRAIQKLKELYRDPHC